MTTDVITISQNMSLEAAEALVQVRRAFAHSTRTRTLSFMHPNPCGPNPYCTRQ
jgi:hypothetical protein